MQEENTLVPSTIRAVSALEHQPSLKYYFDSYVSLYWCTDITQRQYLSTQIQNINNDIIN